MTGFGPFGQHEVNASWVAVKELERLWREASSESSSSVRLQTREIPVAYAYVLNSLHEVYRECGGPSVDLCIHVGVSPYSMIKLERRGQNLGYRHLDIHGQCPSSGCCVQDGPDEIVTQFDLEGVCRVLQERKRAWPVAGGDRENGVEFGVSEDAGRYLCDFIYYKSLHLRNCPVLFVHVPPLGGAYTKERLGLALRDLVEVLLGKMDEEMTQKGVKK